jgi:hypothetical protein
MVAVLLTYNSVGQGLENGRHERGGNVVYVGQGFIRKDKSGEDIAEKKAQLFLQWQLLQERVRNDNRNIADIDCLVINCGKLPTEAMEIAGNFRAEKVKLVHCGCGEWREKDLSLAKAGYIYTACGGIETMGRILEGILQHGRVVSYMTLEEAWRPKGV